MISRPFEAFLRFCPKAPTWDDLLVGYDFSLLEASEIKAWVDRMPQRGPAADRLVRLVEEALLGFEVCLWNACMEATGHTPRPGNLRWMAAHDRWRTALLKELLQEKLSPEELGEGIETLYGTVGCPEDMLEMFSPAQAWSKKTAVAHPQGVASFLYRMEHHSYDHRVA